jgi:hypothetical protein
MGDTRNIENFDPEMFGKRERLRLKHRIKTCVCSLKREFDCIGVGFRSEAKIYYNIGDV